MSEKETKSTRGNKWNTRFNKHSAMVEISYPTDELVTVVCRNVYSKSIKRIAEMIEQENLCESCTFRSGNIEMIRTDHGMMIAVNFKVFLQEAFAQEDYELRFEDQEPINDNLIDKGEL